MKRDISTYLIKKYLRYDPRQPFVTVSALLAFFGVAIGIMVLMVAMAIMNGFHKEFERKLFVMNYPLTIYPSFRSDINLKDLNTLEKIFPELRFSPYIRTQAIIKNQHNLEGGILFGVDFDREKKINSVLEDGIKNLSQIDDFGIVVGKGIKDSLLLEKDDKLTLFFTQSKPTGLSLIPTMKRFDFSGFFESGLIAYDKAYMYTNIESLRKILGYKDDVFDGIHVYTKDPFVDIKRIKQNLPENLKAIGWWEQNGNFFSALVLEKRALMIVLMLIILVASLNIISSLLMTVMNRRSEIALLMSLGVFPKEIKKTFFCLGAIIGGSGMVIGLILGFLSIWLLGNFNIVNLPSDVYGLSKLPLELAWQDLTSVIIGAIAIIFFSSYYPAKKATQVDILQTLRNE